MRTTIGKHCILVDRTAPDIDEYPAFAVSVKSHEGTFTLHLLLEGGVDFTVDDKKIWSSVTGMQELADYKELRDAVLSLETAAAHVKLKMRDRDQ